MDDNSNLVHCGRQRSLGHIRLERCKRSGTMILAVKSIAVVESVCSLLWWHPPHQYRQVLGVDRQSGPVLNQPSAPITFLHFCLHHNMQRRASSGARCAAHFARRVWICRLGLEVMHELDRAADNAVFELPFGLHPLCDRFLSLYYTSRSPRSIVRIGNSSHLPICYSMQISTPKRHATLIILSSANIC